MGCYMNGFGEDNIGKAAVLVDKHGATPQRKPIYHDPKTGKITVCVVENGMFEAVGVAYDEREFTEFTDDRDGRRKTWLTIPLEIVSEYAPSVTEYIKDSQLSGEGSDGG